jgi:hypothetical protein
MSHSTTMSRVSSGGALTMAANVRLATVTAYPARAWLEQS